MMIETAEPLQISPFRGQDTEEYFKETKPYTLPSKATVFTQTHYTDGASWVALENGLKLKKTVFDDERLFMLNPVEASFMPLDLEPSLTGRYDVKLYTKKGVFLCFEGDHQVLIKIPLTRTIISWNSEERFPVFTKGWRPTYYMLNDKNIFIRITPEKCLVISKLNNEESYQVKCIDFADGFVCCHPMSNLAILHGSYDQNQQDHVMKIPPLPPSSGKYSYFIMFFHWGTMIIPKSVNLMKGPLCNAKSNCIALLIIPPKLHFTIEMKTSGSFACSLEYRKDFFITARKTSITEFEVFLLMHDQFVRVEYSFDIRLNKESAPIANLRVPFSFKISKEEKEKKKKDASYNCKWTFDNSKDQSVLIESSNVVDEEDHLMTEDFACLFDAEEGTYYSTDCGIKHCKVFKKLKA